ncbi:hypothetical protein [Nonomuraea salmonea]|uniref:hypothetical protein n=1 Tax=Nonomuraea salmonea TaxID=46181 RepID=UPI0031E5FE40
MEIVDEDVEPLVVGLRGQAAQWPPVRLVVAELEEQALGGDLHAVGRAVQGRAGDASAHDELAERGQVDHAVDRGDVEVARDAGADGRGGRQRGHLLGSVEGLGGVARPRGDGGVVHHGVDRFGMCGLDAGEQVVGPAYLGPAVMTGIARLFEHAPQQEKVLAALGGFELLDRGRSAGARSQFVEGRSRNAVLCEVHLWSFCSAW